MKKIVALLVGFVFAFTLALQAPAQAVYQARNAQNCWSSADKPEYHATVCTSIYYREDTDGTGIKLDQVSFDLSGRGWLSEGVDANFVKCYNAAGDLKWARYTTAADVTWGSPDHGTLNLFPNLALGGATSVRCEYSGYANVQSATPYFDYSTTAT